METLKFQEKKIGIFSTFSTERQAFNLQQPLPGGLRGPLCSYFEGGFTWLAELVVTSSSSFTRR